MENQEVNDNSRSFLRRLLSLSGQGERPGSGSMSQNVIISYIEGLRETSEDSEELNPVQRTLRRRRFTYTDTRAESDEELENPIEEEEYFDFRIYPLTINWKDIYSVHNDSCTLSEIIFR